MTGEGREGRGGGVVRYMPRGEIFLIFKLFWVEIVKIGPFLIKLIPHTHHTRNPGSAAAG